MPFLAHTQTQNFFGKSKKKYSITDIENFFSCFLTYFVL